MINFTADENHVLEELTLEFYLSVFGSTIGPLCYMD